MRDYGKVHASFWTSETTRSMSEDARSLSLYLLTCPHNTIAGVFRLPDGYVCDDMQWTSERVAKAFDETVLKGFANRCGTTKWVWINKHFEWNPPENPNQRKCAAKIAASIPDACCWKSEFMRYCSELMGIKQEPLLNPSKTLQKPEAEAEAEVIEPTALLASKLPPCPQQEIISIYAELLPELPQPRVWEGTRQKNLSARWKWILSDLKAHGKPNESSDAVDFFRRMFAYIGKSDFLMGRSGGWSASLDWIVESGNFAKIIAGNYENKVSG